MTMVKNISVKKRNNITKKKYNKQELISQSGGAAYNEFMNNFDNITKSLAPYVTQFGSSQHDINGMRPNRNSKQGMHQVIFNGIKQVVIAMLVRSLEEILKITHSGKVEFNKENISKSFKIIRGKLQELDENVNDEETSKYLKESARLATEITEVFFNELQEPITMAGDKIMTIGMDTAGKIIGNLAKFSKNIIRIIPVVGDAYIVFENVFTIIKTGTALAASFAEGSLTMFNLFSSVSNVFSSGSDSGSEGIGDMIVKFNTLAGKFFIALSKDNPQPALKEIFNEAKNMVSNQVDDEDKEDSSDTDSSSDSDLSSDDSDDSDSSSDDSDDSDDSDSSSDDSDDEEEEKEEEKDEGEGEEKEEETEGDDQDTSDKSKKNKKHTNFKANIEFNREGGQQTQ